MLDTCKCHLILCKCHKLPVVILTFWALLEGTAGSDLPYPLKHFTAYICRFLKFLSFYQQNLDKISFFL